MQARRLKTQPQFQALLACAPLARTEHFVMHRMELSSPEVQASLKAFPGQSDLWLGAMVPKRWARRAVTRNLIKRQIYHIGEQRLAAQTGEAYLVRLRATYDRQHFRSASSEPLRVAVRSEIEQLFARGVRALQVTA